MHPLALRPPPAPLGLQLHGRWLHHSERSVLRGSSFLGEPWMAASGGALQLRKPGTGSLWAGYNFAVGKRLVLDVTPMIGGVFGRTTGIAPGCEASLSYKRFSSRFRMNISSIQRASLGTSTTVGRNLYLPDELVSRGRGGGTYKGFPHQPRRAAWVPSGRLA